VASVGGINRPGPAQETPPMTHLKKSFNLDADLAQRVDDFLQKNPGISFTLMMNQATARWLSDPRIEVKRPAPVSLDVVDSFLRENADLMNDLSK
jgi:hypothetical protein